MRQQDFDDPQLILAKTAGGLAMGGMGSGNWYRWQGRKTTVEECYALDANQLMREGILAAGVSRVGYWIWSRERDGQREKLATVGYRVRTKDDGTGLLQLQYRLTRPNEDVDYCVLLDTTRPHLGGLRWWFICPLADRWGRGCPRRCAKLYLHGRYFGCRRCHNLSYRSSQEAHKVERLDWMIEKMAARMGPLDPAAMRAGELLGLLRAKERLRV